MTTRSPAETLFAQYCESNGIPFVPVATGPSPTPDFVVHLNGVKIICEIKQIDPSPEDLAELTQLHDNGAAGRYLPNRLRRRLKHVSPQLKAAASGGCPTLLVVYDNTPFKSYTDHGDVVQAMFGRNTVTVFVPEDSSLPTWASAPFCGGDRGMGPGRNTAISAVAILDGGPQPPLRLRVYHNGHAAVRLDPSVFAALPVTQPVRPDSTDGEL